MNSSQTLERWLYYRSIVRCNMNARPRPLPLFLELVREVSERDPELARDALAGLRVYERRRGASGRRRSRKSRASAALPCAITAATGRLSVLVPSLINPPRILDLDEQISLTAAIARMGRRALLLDWGKRGERSGLSVAGHIEELLVPLLREHRRAGRAGRLLPRRDNGDRRREPRRGRAGRDHRGAVAFRALSRGVDAARCRTCGATPKPPAERSARCRWKCCRPRSGRSIPSARCASSPSSARLDPRAPDARRFVELEEWANEGEPLPYPAAKELIEDLFGRDLPGSRPMEVGGRRHEARRARAPPHRRA